MPRKVGAVDFSATCKKLLDEYGIEARKVMNDTIPEAADIAVKMIRADSKKRTGAYARDWAKKQQYTRGLGTSYVVYNKKHYRVAHLLENEHKKSNQYGTYGTTKGDGVIADAEEYTEAWLYDKVVKRLGG